MAVVDVPEIPDSSGDRAPLPPQAPEAQHSAGSESETEAGPDHGQHGDLHRHEWDPTPRTVARAIVIGTALSAVLTALTLVTVFFSR